MDDWSFQMFEEKPKIEDLPLTPSISHPPLPTQLMVC